MKILHVISSYNGGIYQYIRSKYPYSLKKGVYHHIVAFENPAEEMQEEMASYKVSHTKLMNPKKSQLRQFIEGFKDVLGETGCDVIHCHLHGHRALPFYRLAKKKLPEVPFIIHAHSVQETLMNRKRFRSLVTAKIDRIINSHSKVYRASCSDKATDSLFSKKVRQDVTYLPNSINEKLFVKEDAQARAKLRKQHQLEVSDRVIGQIGRLDENKNHRFTIELAQELRSRGQSFKWLFIGEGPGRDQLQTLVKEKELTDEVFFLGRKDDVHRYYCMFDAVIHPSISEGFGIVPIEAQASTRPVLVSDSLPKQVDLQLGLLTFLPLNDQKKWIERLLSITNNKDSYNSKKDKISRLEELNLTDERAAEVYIAYIKKLTVNCIGL